MPNEPMTKNDWNKAAKLMAQITPEQLAKSGSEDGHQLALLCWCALPEIQIRWPQLKYLFAIPNGGYRDKREAAKLKAMGVKAGVPDLCLPVPMYYWHGLYIELKRPDSKGKKAGQTSDEQDEWIAFLTKQGYRVIVSYGWEKARDYLIWYLSQ